MIFSSGRGAGHSGYLYRYSPRAHPGSTV